MTTLIQPHTGGYLVQVVCDVWAHRVPQWSERSTGYAPALADALRQATEGWAFVGGHRVCPLHVESAAQEIAALARDAGNGYALDSAEHAEISPPLVEADATNERQAAAASPDLTSATAHIFHEDYPIPSAPDGLWWSGCERADCAWVGQPVADIAEATTIANSHDCQARPDTRVPARWIELGGIRYKMAVPQ